MKNESFDLLESSTSERTERAKKVYRHVTDISRRLGDVSVESRSMADLFSTNNEVQRQKLKDNCEKLFFLDPLNYGKKSLELLWRKGYYETVSAAKKLKEIDSKYDSYLFTHIVSGVGHFQHIITRIQCEMNIQMKELDYLPMENDDIDCDFSAKFTEEENQLGRWAIYTCLIYLGDLSRYQTELFNIFQPSMAARYYLQAAQVDMTSGMPFNQLGNLFVDKNYSLDSVCYYVHCLNCLTPFDGALGNLTKIFEKNKQLCDILVTSEIIMQVEHIQNTVTNFLLLIEIWYFGKDDTHVNELCSAVTQQLKLALDFTRSPMPDVNDNYNDFVQATEEESVNPSYMNFGILHNMVQICLFTVAKITETDNLKAFACKAFTLALLSQLLQKLLKQLESLGLKSPALKFVPKFKLVPLVPLGKEESQTESIDEEIISSPAITNGNHTSVEVLPTENGDTKVGSNGDTKSNNKKISSGKRRRRRRVISSGSSEGSEEDSESSEVDSEKSVSDDELSNSSFDSEDGESRSDDSICGVSDNEDIDREKINGFSNTINNTNELEKQENNVLKEIETQGSNNDSNMNKDKTNDWEQLNIEGVEQFLLGDNILPSIKLLQDWILTEKDLILSCGESGDSLFQCVVDLLNIFLFYFVSSSDETLQKEENKVFKIAKAIAKKYKLECKSNPLPEDIAIRGTNIGKFDKDAAEWQILEKSKPSVYEENIIRILNFVDFGYHIAKIVPRIRYNKYLKVYYVKKAHTPKLALKVNTKKSREWHNSKKQELLADGEVGGLQQRMGRLWLASRVRELERSGQGPEPTLLVLDSAVLNKFLRRIKQLMHATNFVFLIPTVVLQELDNLKSERSSARDAIRWLEAELKSGSRFLKTQRPGQSRTLPLIKYPRKAPPNVHRFIEILEFCNHFIGDDKHIPNGNGDSDHPVHGKTAPLLILLVGNELVNGEDQYKEFSFMGAAQAAGISVEYFVDFYAKWRQTAHKNGKKR